MYNPFEVLGLNDSATREEVDEAYRALRDELREKRFAVGSEGQEASEKLQMVEQAYKDAMNVVYSRTQSGGSDPYAQIKQLIKEGRCDEAQQMIDAFPTRDAEWHYVQSTIFFKKSWFLEAKKQLEYAIQLQPNNSKYTDALDRLTRYLASNSVSPDQLRTTTRPAQTSAMPNNGTCTGSCCGDVCLANLCANCLCGGCS